MNANRAWLPDFRRLRLTLKQMALRLQAWRIIRIAEASNPALFATPPPEGFQRGIDFYDRRSLIRTTAHVLLAYRTSGGRHLNLLAPEFFSEKINHAKFFTPIKVPESGNKLLTASFIPAALRGRIRVPEIVWHDDQPRLPANDCLPPGTYYLKSNHGSGMVRRIHYPLAPSERSLLEATTQLWLTRPFGLSQGEWWYNTFPRRILLERAVAARSPSLALLFYVVDGEVALISVDEKPLHSGGVTRCLLFDGQFRLWPVQKPERQRLDAFELSDARKQECLEAARLIGKPFKAVRVDLIVGDDGIIYLNEITLSSSAGMPFSDVDSDRLLGGLWPGLGIFRI